MQVITIGFFSLDYKSENRKFHKKEVFYLFRVLFWIELLLVN